MSIEAIVGKLNGFAWGPWMLLLLVGTGVYLTCRVGFLQFRKFGYAMKNTLGKVFQKTEAGAGEITPFQAVSTALAATVGTGNIAGVTGAIAVGGPGALFWMWVSAFFGMATAFVEATLAQIFKEKEGSEYVGGLPFYGRRLLKGAVWAGTALSCLYIIYALLCLPAQGFNTISAVGAVAQVFTGTAISTNSALYWISFAVLLGLSVYLSFGGIKKVSKVTDALVPVMAVVYVLTVVVLIVTNVNRVGWFFGSVFTQAFAPDAIFGGVFGVALSQGIRRGLMSNEAGQGTISMPAAAAEVQHPCNQGIIQALGVFLDTIVICTLTGFVVIMGKGWLDGSFFQLGKLDMFLTSAGNLVSGSLGTNIVTILVSICFGLFALTCLLGFLSFSEICAHRISHNKGFIIAIRVLCLVVIAFGVVTSIAGLDLSALWNLSDFANILMVYCNLPLLYMGWKLVKRATDHYEKGDGSAFTSQVAGVDLPLWDELSKEKQTK